MAYHTAALYQQGIRRGLRHTHVDASRRHISQDAGRQGSPGPSIGGRGGVEVKCTLAGDVNGCTIRFQEQAQWCIQNCHVKLLEHVILKNLVKHRGSAACAVNLSRSQFR